MDIGIGQEVDTTARSVQSYQHSCVLQCMKKISQSNTSVTLKCRGCNACVTVKLNSAIYASWKQAAKKSSK